MLHIELLRTTKNWHGKDWEFTAREVENLVDSNNFANYTEKIAYLLNMILRGDYELSREQAMRMLEYEMQKYNHSEYYLLLLSRHSSNGLLRIQ